LAVLFLREFLQPFPVPPATSKSQSACIACICYIWPSAGCWAISFGLFLRFWFLGFGAFTFFLSGLFSCFLFFGGGGLGLDASKKQ
jgi:hypothetical protein